MMFDAVLTALAQIMGPGVCPCPTCVSTAERYATKCARTVDYLDGQVEVMNAGQDDRLVRTLEARPAPATLEELIARAVGDLTTRVHPQGPLAPPPAWIAAVLCERGAVLRIDPGMHPKAVGTHMAVLGNLLVRLHEDPRVCEARGGSA